MEIGDVHTKSLSGRPSVKEADELWNIIMETNHTETSKK